MNYANPILICDENEEFRILIRDMLMKNGFFHILEAHSTEETMKFLSEKKDYLLLLSGKILSEELIHALIHRKDFIIFADGKAPSTLTMASRLGVEHIMSLPVNSKKLLKKLNSL